MVGMESVKLLMSWDIKTQQERAYIEFVFREFLPALDQMGIQTTDAWSVQYRRDSSTPDMLVGGIMDSAQEMEELLNSDAWATLRTKLMRYIENYEEKVVPLSGGFQL